MNSLTKSIAVLALSLTFSQTSSAFANQVLLKSSSKNLQWSKPILRCHPASPRNKKRFCDGPRKTPKPIGANLERAKVLGLLRPYAAHRLLIKSPKPQWVHAAKKIPKTSTLLLPIEGGRLLRGLQARKNGSLHKGLDIGAPRNKQIVAAEGGLVAYSDNGMFGFGNVVLIVHADASVTLYAHCSTVFVSVGQLVEKGEHIANVGDTGLARGAHLHFEWRIHGSPANPLPALRPRPQS